MKVIDALTGYYNFLTSMYMPDNWVEHAPARSGWQSVVDPSLNAVSDFLRHIPRILQDDVQIYTECTAGMYALSNEMPDLDFDKEEGNIAKGQTNTDSDSEENIEGEEEG